VVCKRAILSRVFEVLILGGGKERRMQVTTTFFSLTRECS